MASVNRISRTAWFRLLCLLFTVTFGFLYFCHTISGLAIQNTVLPENANDAQAKLSIMAQMLKKLSGKQEYFEARLTAKNQLYQLRKSESLSGPYFVLVGVFSSCSETNLSAYRNQTYAARRDAIRVTWKSYPNVYHPIFRPNAPIRVGFVLGEACASHPDIQREQHQHHDLILVDGDDFYQGGKTYRFFQYVSENYLAVHVLKADDDSFLILPLIESALRKLPSQNLYWGELVFMNYWQAAEVRVNDIQEHRGWGYSLSMDLVHRIANTNFPPSFFNPKVFEDVLTGIMLRHLNLTFPDSHLVWSNKTQRAPYEGEVRIEAAKGIYDLTSWLGHNCIFFPPIFPILFHLEQCKPILGAVHHGLYKLLHDVPNRNFSKCEEFDEVRKLVTPCCFGKQTWNCVGLKQQADRKRP